MLALACSACTSRVTPGQVCSTTSRAETDDYFMSSSSDWSMGQDHDAKTTARDAAGEDIAMPFRNSWSVGDQHDAEDLPFTESEGKTTTRSA